MQFLPQLLRVSIWVITACIGVFLVLVSPQWLNQLNWFMQDQIVRQTASDQPVDSVVLIDIDEESIQLLSAWPWPRSLLAELIEQLAQKQVKVIALDMIFPDKTQFIEDEALQKALTKNRAILPIIWDYRGSPSNLAVGGLPIHINQQTELGYCHKASGYVTSYTEMNESASLLGHISPVPDHQGIMRFMPPVVCWQGQPYPMLALSMLDRYVEQLDIIKITNHSLMLNINGRILDVSLESGLWRIPYRYEMSSFTSIPAWQILAGQLEMDLSGKAVIIGSSAVGLNDRVATPSLPIAPGMLLHAQMFVDLLSDHSHNYPSAHWLYGVLVLLITMMMAVIIVRFSIRIAVIWWLLLIMLEVWLAVFIYQINGELVALATGIVLLLLLFVSQSIMEWSLVKRQSYRIYQLFKDYLPDTVLSQLIKSTDEGLLIPQQKEVTVLFADLVDFTRMTETMPTAEAAALTRQVLSLLTEAIHQTHGTLDKYMGDAVMAFWNAPLTQENHRALAIESALLMREAMQTLNEQRGKDGKTPLAIHVGINTGEALVGDLGTEWRHAYTALGDSINVAQRLMMLAHTIGTDIVIGQATATCCSEKLLSYGQHKLSGRTQLEEVFVIPVTNKV
ncbi:MAG: adenylate/guanylate cyclase domain-containing protein [Gammaproteobacteria bacterium]|nr:adenylate/guanylate cyclase domain-containing protein [Gammaproteobacteria bacterium]